MKKLSKIFAVVLALAMVLSILPMGAAAAEETITYDFSGVNEKNNAAISATVAKEIFDAAASGAGLTGVTTATKIYKGNDNTNGAFPNATDCLKTGTSSAAGKLVLTFNKAVTKVEITCHSWTTSSNNKVKVNGSEEQLAPKTGNKTDVLTFDLATASDTVTIDVANRIFIFKIVVTLGGTATGGGGGSTDTREDLPTTSGAIVDAVFELQDGEALDKYYKYTGKITLTGVVSGTTTWYDSSSTGNVNFKVKDSTGAEKTMQAYKLGKGTNTTNDDVKNLTTGDTITVSGTVIKNYRGTFEFDVCELVSVTKGQVQLPALPTSTADIVAAIYALNAGEALNAYYDFESFTLSGTIVGETSWDDQYNNGELTIKVDGTEKELKAYRFKAGEIAVDTVKALAAGDKVTFKVESAKNYGGTYEMEYPVLTAVQKAADDDNKEPDKVGDNTAIVAMTSVMAIAVVALAVLVIGKKRMF